MSQTLSSQAFANNGGFTVYYFVQSTSEPRYPYGICGPFSSESEAENALKRIEAARPSEVHMEKAGFAIENASEILASDQLMARLHLEHLATA